MLATHRARARLPARRQPRRRVRRRRDRHDGDHDRPALRRGAPALELARSARSPLAASSWSSTSRSSARTCVKIPHGGWFPLAGRRPASSLLMTTWRTGRRLARRSPPRAGHDQLRGADGAPRSRPGPPRAGHGDLHDRGIPSGSRRGEPPAPGLTRSMSAWCSSPCSRSASPRIAPTSASTRAPRAGLLRVIARYGFLEQPHIPARSRSAGRPAS